LPFKFVTWYLTMVTSNTTGSHSVSHNSNKVGEVVYCSTEADYHKALEDASNKLVVIDVFAEWYAGVFSEQ
jgi:hypothetical protein